MQAGKLREQVDLLQYQTTRDSFNAVISAYATFTGPIWANVQSLMFGAGEKDEQEQAISIMNYKITIRYSTVINAVNPSYRVRYNSEDYNIKNIMNVDERDRTITLMCNKVAT